MCLQTEMAETGIEQEIAVAPAHMPHVATEEWFNPGFVDECDVIAEPDGFIPFMRLRNLELRHGSPCQNQHVPVIAGEIDEIARPDGRIGGQACQQADLR